MAHTTKPRTEAKALLKKLVPTKTITITTEGPSLEIMRQVPERLLEIASASAETRAAVVKALIRVVDRKPKKRRKRRSLPVMFPNRWKFSNQWYTAIGLLGMLRATEAIDVLTRILSQRKHRGPPFEVFTPIAPAIEALIEIGEPAVPALVKALSHKKASVRRHAAEALARIGSATATRALTRALKRETKKGVRDSIWAAMEAKRRCVPMGRVLCLELNTIRWMESNMVMGRSTNPPGPEPRGEV